MSRCHAAFAHSYSLWGNPCDETRQGWPVCLSTSRAVLPCPLTCGSRSDGQVYLALLRVEDCRVWRHGKRRATGGAREGLNGACVLQLIMLLKQNFHQVSFLHVYHVRMRRLLCRRRRCLMAASARDDLLHLVARDLHGAGWRRCVCAHLFARGLKRKHVAPAPSLLLSRAQLLHPCGHVHLLPPVGPEDPDRQQVHCDDASGVHPSLCALSDRSLFCSVRWANS